MGRSRWGQVLLMDETFLRETLSRVLEPNDVTIALSVVRVGYARTASDLGFTGGRVRHRFFKAIQLLERTSYDRYDIGCYTCAAYLKSVAERDKALN